MDSHPYPAPPQGPHDPPDPEDSYRYRAPRRQPLLNEREKQTRRDDIIASLGTAVPREVTLAFTHFAGHHSYVCRLLFADDLTSAWSARCVRKELIGTTVSELREAWDQAIDAQGWATRLGSAGPHEDRWEPVFGKLAAAGRSAFEAIFLNHADARPMNELTEALCARLRSRRCVIGVWSDELFAPWTLLSLPPGDDMAEPPADEYTEGDGGRRRTVAEVMGPQFLGYRHLIEHRSLNQPATCAGSLIPRGGPDGDRSTPGTLALVHQDLPKEHDKVLDTLGRATTLVNCMSRGPDFLALLHPDKFKDQVIYVCCHGQERGQDPARLYASTTASEAIKVGDVLRAVRGDDDRATAHTCGIHHLKGNPLLYLSVCRAGDFTPVSGESVARVLTELGTSCTIAPEVITPKVLAVEHAERFFRPFLEEGTEVGSQLRRITHDLAREYGTLLGLIYGVKGRYDARLAPAVA
ncbi:hypothetical protein ACIRF8_06120 [Streptomyces sp. NPDC102406]|uniref:hypothetical protein n=1 Tax=Streptomyces sp. NPDC102406 TaxID=3366171 RepID=UPI00381C3E6A